jgi:hypothetical protein
VATKYLRGAFIEFMPTFLIPLPNIVIFQFNPEQMTHAWTQPVAATPAAPAGGQGAAGGAPAVTNPLAVKGVPGESFSFTLIMDSNDTIADGAATTPLAQISGVYSRLAALEMLQYPTGAFDGGLLGQVSASVSAGGAGVSLGGSAGGVDRSVPQSQVPTVLFVWGPGRIVPVRITNLSIVEKLYDPVLLNPTHAEATVGIRVLTPEELAFVTGPLADLAKGAFTYSQGLRQALALANLANAAESIIGMLPI